MKRFIGITACISAMLLAMPNATAQQSTEVHPAKEIIQPSVLTKHELFSEDHTADIVAVESVFSAYVFYNDSHNGPGIASLFTPDAVIHFVWNNHDTFVPTFGTHPMQTSGGIKGEGCVLRGRKQFAQYYGYNRDIDKKPLAIPGPFHHVTTSKMVKVADDGKSAMLTATWLGGRTEPGGFSRIGGTGSYRIYFRKMDEGWEISEFYGISDRPSATTNCDLNGPLPRPED